MQIGMCALIKITGWFIQRPRKQVASVGSALLNESASDACRGHDISGDNDGEEELLYA